MMHTHNQPLFQPAELGLGYHNVGRGLLRAATDALIQKIDKLYGQRCGHIPLNAKNVGILAEFPDDALREQAGYLSALFGRDINVMSFADLKNYTRTVKQPPLVVPYGNLPQSETLIHNMGGTPWGLPGKMTDILKNKSDFYKLVDELAVEGFTVPDYTIVHIDDLVSGTQAFLKTIEDIYEKADLQNKYPLGVMLRASDEDGNYGSALAYMQGKYIIVVPHGDADAAKLYGNWQEALTVSKNVLLEAMDPAKESRVVVSRYLDLANSPGISLVMQRGQVTSLGWNGQLQKPGSKACVGTSTFIPKNKAVQNLQTRYEEQTTEIFENFLRKTAEYCDIDFNTLDAVANTDIMLVSNLERELQKRLGRKQTPFYFAECNPRWTNYTDAILAVLGAERKPQTVANMQEVIKNGIMTIDKYPLPKDINISELREKIFEKDSQLKSSDTRIICRMARNPMGLIFAGDIKRGEKELAKLVINK